MESGKNNPLEEFTARISALDRLQRMQAFPWYATALELCFRLIYRENLEPRKLVFCRYNIIENIVKKTHGVAYKDDLFQLAPSIFAYPKFEFEYVPEMKRDVDSILRVAREMEAEKWLEIKSAQEISPSNTAPRFTFRALRLVKMEKTPRKITLRDGSSVKYTPPPREPRRKRKN